MYRLDISGCVWWGDKLRVCHLRTRASRAQATQGPTGPSRSRTHAIRQRRRAVMAARRTERARARRPRPAARGPLHGYELRKRLNAVLGTLPGPVLRHALPLPARHCSTQGWIAEASRRRPHRRAGADRQARRGSSTSSPPTARSASHDLLARGRPGGVGGRAASASTSPSSPAPTAEVRLRILEGRRSRLEERLDGRPHRLARTRERLDSYTARARSGTG